MQAGFAALGNESNGRKSMKNQSQRMCDGVRKSLTCQGMISVLIEVVCPVCGDCVAEKVLRSIPEFSMRGNCNNSRELLPRSHRPERSSEHGKIFSGLDSGRSSLRAGHHLYYFQLGNAL